MDESLKEQKEDSKFEECTDSGDTEASANVDSSESDLEKCRDSLVRTQADFSNYRKRTERERIDSIRFGKRMMLENLLSISDVMNQALSYVDNADIQTLKQGFKMVVSEFDKFLKSESVSPIVTIGAKFNPDLHEALDRIGQDNAEKDDIIVEEIQKGYRIGDSLLRVAKVKVGFFKEDSKIEDSKITGSSDAS